MRKRLNREVLVELYYGRKLSQRKVAEELGVHRCHVRYNMEEYGLLRRTKSEANLGFGLGRKRPEMRGSTHPSWKGGIRKTKQGYTRVWRLGHPRANNHNYVLEHILVWEEFHGKGLPGGWLIHHLNGIKDDNRPENLVALPLNKHNPDLAGGRHYISLIHEMQRKIQDLELANKGVKLS